MMNYPELVAMLPVPTSEQTARFAEHVADNHSWYKHLPFFPPGASFVFFPNPQAGRGVKADGDRFAVYDIDVGDYFSHHSRLSTESYLEQFGHWDYWVDENPRVPDPQVGPQIYGFEAGRREPLPDGLKRRWSSRFTAFLKPAPPMFRLPPSHLALESEAFVAYARQHQSAHDVARYRAVIGALRRAGESNWWENQDVLSFIEAEAKEQRRRLLATLQRVQGAWSEVRRGRAAP
jgi:hypothetical protein